MLVAAISYRYNARFSTTGTVERGTEMGVDCRALRDWGDGGFSSFTSLPEASNQKPRLGVNKK